MIPSNEALQTFYGTIPLIIVILGIFLRSQILQKDILHRLGKIEDKLTKITERLIILESRFGIVYKD